MARPLDIADVLSSINQRRATASLEAPAVMNAARTNQDDSKLQLIGYESRRPLGVNLLLPDKNCCFDLSFSQHAIGRSQFQFHENLENSQNGSTGRDFVHSSAHIPESGWQVS